MTKDNEISSLLQEAKPLYFAQKRRKKAIKSSFMMLILAFAIQYNTSSSDYIYNLDGLEEEIYLTQTGSYIETFDLPIDEYGFLEIV
ncbi:MAG: hypothetical protein IKW58_01920 [Alphaproteobacteria bacterium]|nr:hypothetical protein [Alphaproteobacteria bacterium]